MANRRVHTYHRVVDLMERLASPRGTMALSSAVSLAACIAILGFGAPPVIFVPIAYGGAVLHAAWSTRVKRRLGRW